MFLKEVLHDQTGIFKSTQIHVMKTYHTQQILNEKGVISYKIRDKRNNPIVANKKRTKASQ